MNEIYPYIIILILICTALERKENRKIINWTIEIEHTDITSIQIPHNHKCRNLRNILKRSFYKTEYFHSHIFVHLLRDRSVHSIYKFPILIESYICRKTTSHNPMRSRKTYSISNVCLRHDIFYIIFFSQKTVIKKWTIGWHFFIFIRNEFCFIIFRHRYSILCDIPTN